MQIAHMENRQRLNNPDQIPGKELFKQMLDPKLFRIYEEMERIIDGYGLLAEWRYYKDGKAWLCKVTNRKKTIVWISLWEGFFKSSFYFTEKMRSGIEKLEIADEIKMSFAKEKQIGKLVPLILDIRRIDALNDFRKIAEYKLSLK